MRISIKTMKSIQVILGIWFTTVLQAVETDSKSTTLPTQDRPNVLWICIEDWSTDLSCYGTTGVHTPYVDKLASEGIRYEWAFTTSPVCSTSRSAMMTGFHQNYIRANQHRENNKQPLPHGVRPIPHLLAESGYFTAIMSKKPTVILSQTNAKHCFRVRIGTREIPDNPFLYA